MTEVVESRDKFTNKFEFYLTALSSAVGLGNVWRFPYLVYRNGGGSFFIPYTFSLVFLGLTFFFFESTIGQYTQLGPISLWRVSPIFKGVGYAMFLMGIYVGIYYNMIVAWAMYYVYASFTALPDVPWTHCNNTWNTHHCVEQKTMGQIDNKSLSPSQEFFYNKVLGMTDGIDEMGPIQGHLVLCLVIAWVLVFLGLMWGTKSLGKVSYFTAIFPYVIITALVINGAMLEGAADGVINYIKPDFSSIFSIDVWSDAATQIFFSLSLCRGSVITLASYNPYYNNTIRDSLFIVIFNSLTSIYAGFAIFSMIGFMAHQIDKPFDEAADHGVGLAFVAYPAALSHLPAPWFWSLMFFIMLIILGFGSQLTIVETIVVNMMEMWPSKLQNRKPYVLVFVCVVMFLTALPMCTGAGLYILQLMDSYAVPYAVFAIGFFEVVAIAWVFGLDKYMAALKRMMGFELWHPIYWKFMLKYGSPAILLVLLILAVVQHSPLHYDEYEFPLYANLIGWAMAISSMLMIPAFALYELSKVWRGQATYKDIFKPDIEFEHENVTNYAIEAVKSGQVNSAFTASSELFEEKK